MDQHLARDEGVARFVDDLIRLSPALREARDEALGFAAPEPVPTPLLLLALGHRLADVIEAAGMDGTPPIFEAIEAALAGGDAGRQQAAAAIIEAVVGRAINQDSPDLGAWPEIRRNLPARVAALAITCVTLDR